MNKILLALLILLISLTAILGWNSYIQNKKIDMLIDAVEKNQEVLGIDSTINMNDPNRRSLYDEYLKQKK